MSQKSFLKLMRWEVEEYLRFPLLEILIAIAIYSILTMPNMESLSNTTYSNLHWGIQNAFLFLIFGVSAVFSRSFAGSLAKGETKLLLSYPIKRWQLFLSKFVALVLMVSIIYGSTFSFQIYLLGLSPLEPMIYVSFFGLLLQLLLFCSITAALSLIIKNEIVSILASILLLYGLENIVSSGITYWSSTGRYKILFGYFGLLTHGELPSGFMFTPTVSDVAVAIAIPSILSTILITICLVYYTRIMEID